MGVFSDGPGLHTGGTDEKINYRSIGRGSGGVPLTARSNRPSWRDFDCCSMASIPGKFETVLYKGNREDKGFGSQAPRFGQEDRHGEAPGPGQHGAPMGLASRGFHDKTVGARGNGPFASRTPRQKAAANAQAPGPGAYAAASGPNPPASARSSSLPHAVFVPHSSVNPAKFNARAAPGPGDYSGAVGLWNEPKTPALGAVMTQSDRGKMPKNQTPGPGAYHDRASSEDPARSRRVPVLPRPRGWTPRPGEAEGISETALLRQSAQLLAEETANSHAMPGPGQYDPKPEVTSDSGVQTSFSRGESQSFRLGNSHMARKWRPGNPGPGEYEAPPSPDRRHPAKAAFAPTAQPRFKEKEGLAPGPAYYSPSKRPDDDFRLNPEAMWR